MDDGNNFDSIKLLELVIGFIIFILDLFLLNINYNII